MFNFHPCVVCALAYLEILEMFWLNKKLFYLFGRRIKFNQLAIALQKIHNHQSISFFLDFSASFRFDEFPLGQSKTRSLYLLLQNYYREPHITTFVTTSVRASGLVGVRQQEKLHNLSKGLTSALSHLRHLKLIGIVVTK